MGSTWDDYQAALADKCSCRLPGCEDDAHLSGLIAKLKREGYAACIECGELGKTDTDYCLTCLEERTYAEHATEEYGIELGDCAGQFYYVKVIGLKAACELVWELAAKYPDKVFVFSNTDRCDYDTSGLSDDESLWLDEALYAGRAAAQKSKGAA